jgi:ketosteroid isomerase-like protein
MNTRLILAGLTTLSLLAQTPAPKPAPPGQASATVTQALTRMEEAWNAALLKADVAALEKIYAEEYLSIDFAGTLIDRKQDLAEVASGVFKAESLALSDLRVREYGPMAIVTGVNAVKATYKGEKIDKRHRFTDVWIKRNGRWQCVSTHGSTIQPQ